MTHLIALAVKIGIKLLRYLASRPEREQIQASRLKAWENISLWLYELGGKAWLILRTPETEGEFVVDPARAKAIIGGAYQHFEACLASWQDGRDGQFLKWLAYFPSQAGERANPYLVTEAREQSLVSYWTGQTWDEIVEGLPVFMFELPDPVSAVYMTMSLAEIAARLRTKPRWQRMHSDWLAEQGRFAIEPVEDYSGFYSGIDASDLKPGGGCTRRASIW